MLSRHDVVLKFDGKSHTIEHVFVYGEQQLEWNSKLFASNLKNIQKQ
jgi:hypothetical protein